MVDRGEEEDITHIHDTVRSVAKSFPWLFPGDPNNINPNIVVVQGQKVQTYNSIQDASNIIQPDDDANKDVALGYATNIDNKKGSTAEIDEKDTPESKIPENEGNEQQIDDIDEVKSLDEIIRQKLSVRAYHLPGNNWCQDWRDYIRNNHLIFGLCCHDRLHPVKNKHRIILLLGSLAFGLIVTNLVYLWGDAFSQTDEAVQSWGKKITHYNETELLEGDIQIAGQWSLSLDPAQLSILWTVGSGVHALFDYGLWHLIANFHACHCGQRSCDKVTGFSIAVSITMIVLSVTCVMVYFRAFEVVRENDDVGEDDSLTGQNSIGIIIPDKQPDLSFLNSYLIEVFFALFVYSIIVQTVLFSGVLGCGRLMFCGGRPRALRNEKKVMVEV